MDNKTQEKLNVNFGIACKAGNLDWIKKLVKDGADIYETPLADWYWGELDAVKYWVEIGLDVTAENNTPIKAVCSFGDLECVKFLIEKGADIHADENECLLNTLNKRNTDILKYLILEHHLDESNFLTYARLYEFHEMVDAAEWCQEYKAKEELAEKLQLDLETKNIVNKKTKI